MIDDRSDPAQSGAVATMRAFIVRHVEDGLPAGVLDAGLASLATFIAGLAGVNLLADRPRGVYGVFFVAFMLAAIVPQYLVYIPAEVMAVAVPREERLHGILQNLRIAAIPTLSGVLAVAAAAITTRSQADGATIQALSVTVMLVLALSPAQDHLRRLLHIAERSWQAAIVSGFQVVVVAAAVGAMMWRHVPVVWVPFGALAAANAVSITVALLFVASELSVPAPLGRGLRSLARSGKWLLTQALVPSIAGFIAAALITTLAGAEAYGFAEAARVVAQPILVLGTGLTAVLGPKAMAAAMDRDRVLARRLNRRFVLIVGAAGLAYLAIVGWVWPGNPMAYIVPPAYVVRGLVAVTIVGAIASGGLFLFINELIGARKEIALTVVTLISSPLVVAVAATSAVTGAFSRPLGLMVDDVARYIGYLRTLDGHYRGSDPGTG